MSSRSQEVQYGFADVGVGSLSCSLNDAMPMKLAVSLYSLQLYFCTRRGVFAFSLSSRSHSGACSALCLSSHFRLGRPWVSGLARFATRVAAVNSSFSSVRRLVPALATVSDGVVDVFSLAEGALQFAQTVALAVTGACSCSSGSLRFRCLRARRRCSCSLRRQCAWQSHVQFFTLQNYVHLLPPVQ